MPSPRRRAAGGKINNEEEGGGGRGEDDEGKFTPALMPLLAGRVWLSCQLRGRTRVRIKTVGRSQLPGSQFNYVLRSFSEPGSCNPVLGLVCNAGSENLVLRTI